MFLIPSQVVVPYQSLERESQQLVLYFLTFCISIFTDSNTEL